MRSVSALLLALAFVAPTARSQPGFVDVTATSGVGYLQHLAQVAPSCIFTNFCEPERMSGAAAVDDVDGDGDLDLFVTVIDAPDILFLNQGDGTFLQSATSGFDTILLQSNGAVFGDVDNDGDPDLYLTTLAAAGDPVNTRHFLYVNDGAGSFTEEAISRGVAVDSVARHQCWGVSFGDYDLDGWLDLHTTEWNYASNHSRLFRNLGAASPGYFTDVTFPAGVGAEGVIGFASVFSDMDGDRWPDLFVAGDFGTSRLYRNDGSGGFDDITAAAGVGTDENGMGSTLGDWDGDGDLDWFVTSIHDAGATCDTEPCNWGYSGNRLYRNDGLGSFTDVTDLAGVREGYWGWGAAFFDYDNDGDLDLVMTNGVDFPLPQSLDDPFNADPMRFWENDGSGQMTELSASVGLAETGSGKGLVVFDYDDDGDLDLFIVNNAGQPLLMRNDGGNANHWLRVRVIGSVSNRDGLGARVSIDPGPGYPAQVREIGTTSHFNGQSERVAHFGLGPTGGIVPGVLVRWAGGKTERYVNVAADTTLVADEASCVDADVDGFCLGADCNDADPATHLEADEVNDGLDNQCPGDFGFGLVDETSGVSGFFDPGDGDRYLWPPQPGATMYEAQRSDSPDFAAGCVGTLTADPFWSDPYQPAPGAVAFYLNRAVLPASGSWGARSDGSERTVPCL